MRVSNMMTRKDYIATAEILKTYSEAMDNFFFEDLVNDFADMFAEDNDRFNRVRFLEACNWNTELPEEEPKRWVKDSQLWQAIREAE